MPRQYVRHAVDLEAHCSIHDTLLESRVTNLSRGGLFIASELSLPLREEVEVVLTLPDRGDDIRAHGQVIWSRDAQPGPSGMGIKFLEMPPVDSEKLEQYLAVLPQPSRPGRGEPPR